jgi:hypothetical protein
MDNNLNFMFIIFIDLQLMAFAINRLAVSIKDGANIILPNLELQGKVAWNNQLVTRAAPWIFCSHVHANYSS